MLRNTKIAFVIHGLPMGGAEKFMIGLINYFFEKGHNPILIMLSNDNKLLNEVNYGIKIYTIIKHTRYDLTISKKIRNIISEENVDKVFCINSYSFFLTKIAFLFNKKIHFYLSIHSTIPKSIKNAFLNFIYYRLLSKNDNIIYLCENQKKYLIDTYLLPKTNHFIINNGINTEYFNPIYFNSFDNENTRFLYNLTNEDSIILKVARIQPEKGHDDAIEALYILHNKYKEKAHLFFVGDGPELYKSSLTKHISKKKLAPFIHFVGNHEDVRSFYNMADIFTLTSYNTETFSLAALEAMAFGLPCSLTNIGGASEMSIPGKTGLLTTPHDPLSIADSWYKLLTSKIKKPFIRQYILDNFKQTDMFINYQKVIGY